MPIVESFTSQSNQPDGDVMCILPPSILRDPLVRLALELRATYASWGAIAIAPSTRGIKLALRATAARIGMPGLPDSGCDRTAWPRAHNCVPEPIAGCRTSDDSSGPLASPR